MSALQFKVQGKACKSVTKTVNTSPLSDATIKAIGNITPYPFQNDLIESMKNEVRDQWAKIKNGEQERFEPVIIEAYVSAGKTILLGAMASHMSSVGGNTLILARTGELVEQNAEECWNMDAENSVFSASLGIKSVKHKCIVGTEGTVANALYKQFLNKKFHQLLIDEAHEVHWREALQKIKDPNYETNNQYALILAELIRRNPKMAIIGVTGTPYRGSESIISKEGFWKRRIGPRIDRDFLVDNGYIVPTIFGYGELEYDYHEWDGQKTEGTEDFGAKDLKAMGDKADVKLTHKIMREVMEITKNRLGVLITCASEKHCKQAASVLPDGTWAIVTQSTGNKKRKEILDKAKEGKLKYILQIGCLTTGVNVPFWDTSVLLRRIGSLTLLTQLLGRGMRLLKPWQEEAGWVKHNHLCLDYSGTMAAMQELFDDPILDDAVLEKNKKRNEGFKTCPKCASKGLNGENHIMARRCNKRVTDEDGVESRCDYFWHSKTCENKIGGNFKNFEYALVDSKGNALKNEKLNAESKDGAIAKEIKTDSGCEVFYGGFGKPLSSYTKCFVNDDGNLSDEHGNVISTHARSFVSFEFKHSCGTENDKCAQVCRSCDAELIDPNEKLGGKAYGEDEWKEVESLTVGPTKNGGVVITVLFKGLDANGKVMKKSIFFNPFSEFGRRGWMTGAVAKFAPVKWSDKQILNKAKNIETIMKYKHFFKKPDMATYRPDIKSIHGVSYNGVRKLGGKRVANDNQN